MSDSYLGVAVQPRQDAALSEAIVELMQYLLCGHAPSRAARIILLGVLTLSLPSVCGATGVPFGGFLPFVGIGMTDEYKDEDDPDNFFTPSPSETFGGMDVNILGAGGTPYYDMALLDTGANGSLITNAAHVGFNLNGAGLSGTTIITITGASGSMNTVASDPLGLYATGLANRTGTAPLTLDNGELKGQTSVGVLSMPASSGLPNILGLPFASQYATHIYSDQPQLFQLDGKTVRTPHIEFHELGSGGGGIVRRAPLFLDPSEAFTSPPLYVFNFFNALNGLPLTEDPLSHTAHFDTAGNSRGGLFLSTIVENNVDGEVESLEHVPFLFDTGADVTTVSELNAARLGFDVLLDVPDFTVTVIGAGGSIEDVPGFFVDELTIEAVGGHLVATNVPVLALNLPNPADPGNFYEGIVGTNLFAGRNIVIDPNPAISGGAQLYISDPVTTNFNWTSTAASGTWPTGGNWNQPTAPGILGIANVRHVSGGNQEAVLSADTTVWELNVSGTPSQTMTVRINSGATLTTFSGVNLEVGGVLHLQGDAVVDTQLIELQGGRLQGEGMIVTGSGPIPGQVENRIGSVAPGDGVGKLGIVGRFANAIDGVIEIEVGGANPGTQFDQIAVEGQASLAGTLQVFNVDLGIGFSPDPGDMFEIITASEGLGGQFDTLLSSGPVNWGVTYDSNSVWLFAGLTGDFNDDLVVDARDYSLWRDSMHSTTDLAADANGNLMVDWGDYLLWREYFGSTLVLGAGASAGFAAAVPEPGSLLLLLLGLPLAFCGMRRRRR